MMSTYNKYCALNTCLNYLYSFSIDINQLHTVICITKHNSETVRVLEDTGVNEGEHAPGFQPFRRETLPNTSPPHSLQASTSIANIRFNNG